ncbi:hypothetical protein B0H13DRAFT_128158 [Mycena leptocephala]|nr:hypothetical protein B0H13DRAFT_128158 [Mycena leptocephala]
MSQISSALRSGEASPSKRYRTALSRRDVLLLAAPPFVVALESLAFELDLALELCESSDFALDFLPAALEDVEDASAAAVLTPCVRLPLIVAAIDKSLVLPAKCANHPLSRVANGPSAPNRLGVRASVKSCCCPWPELEELEEGGGVDAEKCRSERVRGRAVPYALGGLLGAKP